MNTLDLLNEISTSSLAKKTDKQLAYDNDRGYSYERFYPIWYDYMYNNLSWVGMKTKYKMSDRTFRKYAEQYNLKMRNFQDSMELYNKSEKAQENRKKGRESLTKKSEENQSNLDIINGMGSAEWSVKYNTNRHVYHTRKVTLRKKGLVQ